MNLLRGLMPTSLLAIAGLTVMALGPGLLPTLAFDGAEAFALDRPVAPVASVASTPGATSSAER